MTVTGTRSFGDTLMSQSAEPTELEPNDERICVLKGRDDDWVVLADSDDGPTDAFVVARLDAFEPVEP